MKKKSLLVTVAVCALLLLCSASVFAADDVNSIALEGAFDLPSASVVPLETPGVIPSEVTPFWKNYFTDVDMTQWFYNYVQFMVSNGFFEGTSFTTFEPDLDMSRAMVVTVIYRMENEPKIAFSGRFPDVASGKWYSNPVEWAAKNGIVNGRDSGVFSPDDSITREEFIAMLFRYADWKGYDVSARQHFDFADDYHTSPYAVDAMQWATAKGIINGMEIKGDMYLKPRDFTTRAQVAKILSVFAVEYMGIGQTDSATLNFTQGYVAVNDSLQLYPVVTPDNAYGEMAWTSSNTKVATVSRGKVIGCSVGTAVITGTTFDGRKVTCTVRVGATAFDTVVSYLQDEGYAYDADDGSGRCWTKYYTMTENGVEYTIGLYYFAPYNGNDKIYLVRDSVDSEFEYETGVVLTRDMEDYFAYIDIWDSYEAVEFYGEAPIYAPGFDASSNIYLDYFDASITGYDSAFVKEWVRSELQEAVHFSLGMADDYFLQGNLGVTIKDFGFTSY